MKKNLALMICLFFLGGVFLSGCDEPPPPAPPKPKIVRKKIGQIPPEVLKKETAEKGESSSPQENPSDEEKNESSGLLLAENSENEKGIPPQEKDSKTTPSEPDRPAENQQDADTAADEETDAAVKTETAVKEGTAENVDTAGAEQTASPEEEPEADKTHEENGLKDEKTEDHAEKLASAEPEEAAVPLLFPDSKDKKPLLAYNSDGKIDPFVPLFRNEPEKKEIPKVKKIKKPTRRLTPLEKLDLGQLKLVGIVWAENGNKALVEESSGKGYIITKGTYIGIHSGRVVDILKDKIVVEEQDEDEEGNPITHKRELKFQRPDGELL